MRPNHLWLKIINVHTHEWGVVRKLFWLQFFQGVAISFFFTAVFTRFLFKFPVHLLPWVLIISAFLQWAAGFLYAKLEHLIPFRKFNLGIILTMALSIFLVILGNNYIKDDWLYYLSLAWFYVLYLLNNLEFWGIAAQLFDIRQSKRLFGVISAGDIPAKFIGYTLAWSAVKYTGTNSLLLIGFFCMLLSIPFLLSIARSEEKSFSHLHHSHLTVHHSGRKTIHTLVGNFFNNKIIFRIALISLLASASMIIVTYGFYAKVKEAYSDDESLASFIALFKAGLAVTALVTKTILTSRLTTNIGVSRSLFITPVAMMLLILLMLSGGFFATSEKMVFYLFGGIYIAIDVLRTSINSPVLLTIMQPLPTHERIRAHNIVKGIMDPFATFLCGALLLGLYYIEKEVNLNSLCYLLLIIGLLWIIGIARVNNVYVKMLINTISSRFFSQEEFTLNDPQTIQKIKEKISTGTYPEVLSILQMVSTKQNPLSAELLVTFLHHPSEQVRLEAIRLIGNKQIGELKEELNTVLLEDPGAKVKTEAIRTICRLAESYSELQAYLNHPDISYRQAAITGMLSNDRTSTKNSAEIELHKLLKSEQSGDRETALQILQEVKDEYDHPDHALLVASMEPGIRKKAMEAVGKGAHAGTIQSLIVQLGTHNKQVYKALQNAGEKSITPMEMALEDPNTIESTRLQLIKLCGKIGGNRAKNLLVKLLQVNPVDSPEIIKALYRCKFFAESKDLREQMEELGKAYIKYAVELLHMQKILPNKDIPAQLIYNSVHIELQEIRELLLCLFSFLYDRDQIKKVRNGLNANHRESIANAMEIIELTVRKDIGKYFNLLFENLPLEQKCASLRFLNADINFQKTNQVLGRILSEKPINYQDWTKACSMYISKKYQLEIDRRLLEKFLYADNPMLQETANYARA